MLHEDKIRTAIGARVEELLYRYGSLVAAADEVRLTREEMRGLEAWRDPSLAVISRLFKNVELRPDLATIEALSRYADRRTHPITYRTRYRGFALTMRLKTYFAICTEFGFRPELR